MTFHQAVAFVLQQEGEGSDDPRDPGGRTRFGVSSRAHPDVDLDTLTREGAIALYHQRYWNLCSCEALPGPLRLPVFDAAVQHGPTQAIRLLQDALGVTRDGILGPKTRAAAEALPWRRVVIRYCVLRLRLYAGLPHWTVFQGGWTDRLFSLQAAVYDSQLQGGA